MLDLLFEKRALLVTGKGGVGKTTLVAALARQAAALNKRVLVAEVSTFGDENSPLAALFGLRRFPRDRIQVMPNVWATILLAQVGQERFLVDKTRSRRLAKAALASKAVQRLLATAPSGREMGLLYHALSEFERRDPNGRLSYDLLIVDMPATGHALGITSLPRILLNLFGTGHIADTLRAGQASFCGGAQAHALVVCCPQPLIVSEAVDLMSGLERDDVRVGAVVVNQVTDSTLLREERERLRRALADRPILGRHSLSRLLHSQSALDRLERESKVPLLKLPYFAFGDVVSKMGEALGANA
jgi:anion-transporting  ArsA/GET3 family ATPase